MSAQQLPADSILEEGGSKGDALHQWGTSMAIHSSPSVNARLSAKATTACCRRLGRKAGRLPDARRTAIPVQASSPSPAAALSAAFRSTAGMHQRRFQQHSLRGQVQLSETAALTPKYLNVTLGQLCWHLRSATALLCISRTGT